MWDRVERKRKLFVEEMLLLPTIIVYHFAVKFVLYHGFIGNLDLKDSIELWSVAVTIN
jgi:hypothetical protein